MAVEHIHLVKRTIWIAKCPDCGDSVEKTDSAPRERYCNPCKHWVAYVEQSAVGPEYGKK
jgi:hypothetical protein